jgi:glyoxylase-like metal-dependent hydrolase (beta-lactamase superfamily II)
VRIDRVTVGPLDTNCWVVSDDQGGPAAVIDPGDDADAILAAIGDRALAIVVLTHGHFDHVGACEALLESRPAPIAVHALDAPFITSPEGTGGSLFGFEQHIAPPAERELTDGDVITVGRVQLTVLHTPGHTPGSICLLAADDGGGRALFSGDTLFAGGVGRTDFPRGDGRALAHSIASKLAPLDSSLVVYPGHGPGTTIGREATTNVFWPRA